MNKDHLVELADKLTDVDFSSSFLDDVDNEEFVMYELTIDLALNSLITPTSLSCFFL